MQLPKLTKVKNLKTRSGKNSPDYLMIFEKNSRLLQAYGKIVCCIETCEKTGKEIITITPKCIDYADRESSPYIRQFVGKHVTQIRQQIKSGLIKKEEIFQP